MYKRLLVTVDGSSFAESVLPYALGISRATKAQLTLMRVVDADGQRAEASRYVDALAEKLGAEGRCMTAKGDVAPAILEEAARVPGTLVVMTSHGRSGVLGAVLGSVAMNVLRAGGEPVVVYRPHERSVGDGSEAITIRRIVVPMDGSPGAESIGTQAAELARWLGARLDVVTVLDKRARPSADAPVGDVSESSYVRTRAGVLGKKHGVEVGWEVLHGSEPEQAIADFIGQDRGAMVAMVTRANAARVEAAFLGSVTTGCLRKVGVPMLIRLP